MKEKIYTIPVTEAFEVECECPLCLLEKKLEDEYVDYTLGPSMMEPDQREETNDKGFCRRHFGLLFSKQSNKLGLGLVLDTHMTEQNKKFRNIYEEKIGAVKKDIKLSLVENISNKLTAKKSETDKLVDRLLSELEVLNSRCTICSKLDYTMSRYIEIIFHLWSTEEDFRSLFKSKKGFCLMHLRELLLGAKTHLGTKETAIFVNTLLDMQLENMNRIQEEVNWFTKKFDYRYNDAPWGNSKDAIPRGIRKMVGYCDFKD
jgi:hypothetical protein